MQRGGGTDATPAGSHAYWQRWGGLLGATERREQLPDVLLEAAGALGDALATPLGVAAVGVGVIETQMRDRSGGIVDGWERKIVLVDRSHRGQKRDYVIAHEIGHLLFGYVHRSHQLQLGRGQEEKLCDQFAEEVIRASAGRVSVFPGGHDAD